MKYFLAAVAVTLLAATPSNAQSVDFRNLSCKEVAAMPPQTLERVAIWIEGYSADEEDAESMAVDLSDTIANDLKEHCAKNPTKRALQAADDLE